MRFFYVDVNNSYKGIFDQIIAFFFNFQYNIICANILGGLSEWSIVRHSKCRVPKGTQGSNPWPSAIVTHTYSRRMRVRSSFLKQ